MTIRVILTIELIILCAPAILILSLGVIYLPALLFGSASGEGDWHIGLLMVCFGLWGFISLVNLARHTISKENNWDGRPVQWFGLILGFVACIIALSTMATNIIMLFVFIGPVIAAAHLLYLSKQCSLAS